MVPRTGQHLAMAADTKILNFTGNRVLVTLLVILFSYAGLYS